jgi:TolB protein
MRSTFTVRLGFVIAGAAVADAGAEPSHVLKFAPEAQLFAPRLASTEFSDARLTISPDGRTALWFTRNRPGGAGGYDIWMMHRTAHGWGNPTPVSFSSSVRDFDPAFSSDGRFVYFCSDRSGGHGGDDIYRVAVNADHFGEPVLLGPEVNSAGNEWAPMLSADGRSLLFSSNGRGNVGGFDLFIALRQSDSFAPATALQGELNTTEDEFDATFLSDNATVVFSRSADLRNQTVHLYYAAPHAERYPVGERLPSQVNSQGSDTYAPMLDWSHPSRLTFSGQRPEEKVGGVDLYVIEYQLVRDLQVPDLKN